MAALLGLALTLPGVTLRAEENAEIPRDSDEAAVIRGGIAFRTYCVLCHGTNGKGDGPLVVAGKIPTPPAYTSVRVAPFPPGRIFHVVTMGTQKMPSYAALLTPAERWKVVGYVSRKLQRSEAP
jgi:mono/diheme cytochrome c family protein